MWQSICFACLFPFLRRVSFKKIYVGNSNNNNACLLMLALLVAVRRRRAVRHADAHGAPKARATRTQRTANGGSAGRSSLATHRAPARASAVSKRGRNLSRRRAKASATPRPARSGPRTLGHTLEGVRGGATHPAGGRDHLRIHNRNQWNCNKN